MHDQPGSTLVLALPFHSMDTDLEGAIAFVHY